MKLKLIDYITGFDRRLVFPWMNTVGLRLTGYKLYDVYNSPARQLQTARVMDEIFQADFVYPMDDGVLFSETLGMTLEKCDYDFPTRSAHPIKDSEALAGLRVPDPYHDGRMPVNLETYRLLADSFAKPLAISLEGPFTLAAELMGTMDFIRAIIRDPQFVQKLLSFSTEVVAAFARAAVEAGVKLVCISEPTAVLLSPRRFELLVSVNLRKIYEGLDAWKVLHVCGDTTYLMRQLTECGAEGLSLDQVVNLAAIVPQIPEEVVIIGNIDPLTVLYEMSPGEIKEQTLALLQSMKGYPNFMVSFGCDCLPDTPVENLKAAMEAGRSRIS